MTSADTLAPLAHRAFIYGFPLVFDLEQVVRYVETGIGANAAADFNTFSHGRVLASPADRFVTINNDTVYSFAQLNLSAGPLLLSVPETGQRYHVFQFISAWTDNFAYIGKRATGTGGGRYLLVPPHWQGGIPEGVQVIQFPTTIATINCRWAVDGPEDLQNAALLQDATTLTKVDPAAVPAGIPVVEQQENDALLFWERYRVWSQAFAPAPRDAGIVASFEPLGLTGDIPVAQLPAEIRAALEAGYASGLEFVQSSLRGGFVPEQNGWQLTLHAFDYNVDHFEIGAIDDPQWRIEETDLRLVTRAGAALGGLWGNHAYEAAYIGTYVDDQGEQLNGQYRYQLTLDPTPPNNAFWSLTMYDVPDYYLVENPIARYSIGDRTPGTVPLPGGGITITMSHEEPEDPAERANWLPTPAGDFRPMLRVYLPGNEVLNGEYVLPAITRIPSAKGQDD